MKTLVILDSQSILHRAYHALPSFTSPQGFPTGALYGFSSVLLKIIKDLKPDYLVAARDLPSPTFRHIIYEKYKAHRPKAGEELKAQIEPSCNILKAFGIPIYEKEGFEADDVIGTIVSKIKDEKDLKIIIVSVDLDIFQLVENEKISVNTLKTGVKETVFYDDEGIKKRFGFKPKFLADYKGLKGDPSDNIPRIKGIGEKTAAKLIKQFGSLKNILDKAEKEPEFFEKTGFGEKLVKLLLKNKEQALFSKELAAIRKDVPLKVSFSKKIFYLMKKML